MKNIYKLKLHEQCYESIAGVLTYITRVPGGWVYQFTTGECVFVPWHNEFQPVLQDHSDKIDLLEAYSRWMEEQGYTDTDWRTEEPYAIDEFLKQLK